MCWWTLGDPVVITRDGVEFGATVTRKPSYLGNDPLWVTSDDGEVIKVTTRDLVRETLHIRMLRGKPA